MKIDRYSVLMWAFIVLAAIGFVEAVLGNAAPARQW